MKFTEEVVFDLLKRLWENYEEVLKEHPLPTEMATSGVLWGIGDVAAHAIENLKWQLWRTLLTVVYGAVFMGPTGHYFYLWLDIMVGSWFAQGSFAFLATKMAFDMVVFGVVHVLAFFTFLTLAETGSWQAVQHKIQTDFWPTYAAEWLFWPAYMAVVFVHVPVQHQLLAVNVGCIVDSTFMCWARSQAQWAQRLMPAWLLEWGGEAEPGAHLVHGHGGQGDKRSIIPAALPLVNGHARGGEAAC